MKQLTFNWEAKDKYDKLKNYGQEVHIIFKSYSMPKAEQIAIIKDWLGRKGLLFRNINTGITRKMEQNKGLFTTLKELIQTTIQWNYQVIMVLKISQAKKLECRRMYGSDIDWQL